MEAWDAFQAAGLTVDFVTPEGNAAPINVTEVGEFRSRFYDADLMYALAHTYTPAQIDPARYRAVYFVGGSNAIYGVPENTQLQNIAMHVYERNGGVVSAVCHGTAELVNLKLSDGKYLVGGQACQRLSRGVRTTRCRLLQRVSVPDPADGGVAGRYVPDFGAGQGVCGGRWDAGD